MGLQVSLRDASISHLCFIDEPSLGFWPDVLSNLASLDQLGVSLWPPSPFGAPKHYPLRGGYRWHGRLRLPVRTSRWRFHAQPGDGAKRQGESVDVARAPTSHVRLSELPVPGRQFLGRRNGSCPPHQLFLLREPRQLLRVAHSGDTMG